MTHDDKANAQLLEEAFATLRSGEPVVSEDFLSRVQADALTTQKAFEMERQHSSNSSRFLFRPRWSAWAGLAACLVLGVGLGGGFSNQIGAFGDYYLSGGLVGSGDLLTSGYTDFLLFGEG